MTKLERQILKKQHELKELRIKRAEEKRLEAIKRRGKAKPKGRPRIAKVRLLEAKLLALDNPLTWVAFKMNLSLITLRRYGITRKNLNREIEEATLPKIENIEGANSL
ncbi:MAG: hypothetical protein K1X72_16865 [Pyrinomonadaceae bacterium]|nr:hypothetical protein [Pyrinomonadaceae bacterium]